MAPNVLIAALQIVVGAGLLNVWLVRSRAATAYRGGQSVSLREEFAVYGLPAAAFYVVGGLKIASALVLIAGVWVAAPVRIAAAVVAALMVGALLMHLKVKDPVRKSLPALAMLAMSLTIALLAA
jgi:hypothetical protein